jgi:hypothetical protein
MATLVYKMTHKGDPDSDLGIWGVEDCMGQVRDYEFDAVIGIGGRSWSNETSRMGEIVWIGLGPEMVDRTDRGPVLRFAHFRYFREGELMLRTIAPNLEKAMYNCRFKLYRFSRLQEQEIARIRKKAKRAGRSARLNSQASNSQMEKGCRPRLRRRKPC